jgi:hypothetical protein
MSNGNRKEFLNNGILGGGAGIADKRSFRAVRTEYITSPDYDPKYFETFPTAWAAAYAFRKVLDLPAKPGTTGELFLDEVSQAVEEWATLFLLHYFGVVYLAEFNENELRLKYDKDLWLALSGTYPSAREQAPKSIRLLQTRTGTVVGAYYPAVIFFPARDRTRWTEDEALQDYVRDGQLSWAASKRTLFVGEQEERDFHTHLRLIADHGIPNSTLKDRLHEFSQREFPERIDLTEATDNIDREVLQRWSDPAVWKIPGRTEWEPSQLLEMYPLKKEDLDPTSGAHLGWIFYMVTGLPSVPWMKTAVAPGGPAPYQYRKLNDNQIVVELPGRKFFCDKLEGDRIEVLRDVFLKKDLPHWCKVPKAAEGHTQRIKSLHRVGKLRDQVLFDNEIAVCLAPITLRFLQSFPELMERAEQSVSVEPNADATTVTWVFKLMDKEIKWQTALSYSKGIAQASIALWPPKLSTKWKLYAAYGIGGRQDCGRWNLVDERGQLGERFEVEENEEYISVLQGTSGHPNRPRALLLHDSEGHERGVLFLADLDSVDPNANPDPTVLAVDFGTSNTCFAYDDGVREILRFGLAPEILWGKSVDEKRLESPGFVPFRWGGAKGFFPTVLLSRISDQSLTDQLLPKDVTLHHLFKVDVPCLHRELEDRLFYGQLDKVWKIHASLKWDVEGKTEPWRTLFLQQTLLYAHAEMFFNRRRIIDSYIFTFPLAYSRDEQQRFHAKAMAAVHKIRHYCYGSDLKENLPYAELKQELTYEDAVDESTAVAAAIRAPEGASNMEVFVDVGGGTADIAIRHNGRFLVLDSLKVAGNTFFNFASTNFKEAVCGAPEFKKHLGRLLQGKEGEITLPHLNNSPDFRLNVFYSVAVNSLGDEEFRDREQGILKKGMGSRSYQKFRTRLFFRHLIAYALLQSCAAVVDNKLKLSSGINLILGGNGWGLMLFAELPRQRRRIEEEAKEILKLLKSRLSKGLSKDAADCLAALEKVSVNLLNESDLSKAKTNVALGALNADPQARGTGKTAPYGGITLRDFRMHDRKPIGNKKSPDLNWWDRWSFEEMKERFGFMDAVKDVSFRTPEDQEKPLDETLAIFSCVGNIRGYEQDNMPPEIWNSINTAIMKNLREISADRMDQTPINYFLSTVLYEEKPTRDFLDALAEANDHFKS